MNVLIIGGVAAGTKTAAKLKRLDRAANVTIITQSNDISYAGCGLPYYVGGGIESRDELIVNTPESFMELTGVNVKTAVKATAVDPENKTVTALNLERGNSEQYHYDKLVIATGASASRPPIQGIDLGGIFTLRTPGDAEAVKTYAASKKGGSALVVGGGFIGLEAADNLLELGFKVTIVEAESQLLPGVLDSDMADYLKRQLEKNGMRVLTGTKLSEFAGEGSVSYVVAGGMRISCDIAVVAAGIRPNTEFLKDSGINLSKGLVVVDDKLKTNLNDIYAVGDCAVITNRLTGAPQWSPMGSHANLEGRTLAKILAGRTARYPGTLGTSIVKAGGLNCGRCGLLEGEAKKAGYDPVSAVTVSDDKAHYYPGSAFFITKLTADRNSKKLLGAQVIGPGAVDKMVDIVAMALSFGGDLEQLDNIDFAYAPPFSTAIHPFTQAVQVLGNKLCGDMVSITPAEYATGMYDSYRLVDASKAPQLAGADYVDLTKVDGPVKGLDDKNEKLLLVCNRGKRAYLLQNRLRYYGCTNTVVLEGATFVNEIHMQASKVSAADMAAVKALGFLWDKRTPDRFNARVITRNGKITAEQSRVIAEAAERFGSGEITMTSRLTIEIQSVPFKNIRPLIDFLSGYGLETGGTGSKVRPVVSCKGTTCQYGLIDTFDLSNKIHERFYKGYHDIKLAHKFKIAVGGCPNNCVKPDLNDLGIIGQRVPVVDYDKCRSCKKCQVEQKCPISAASFLEGKLTIDSAACNNCGRCIKLCPFGAVSAKTTGYRVYIGGRWGKKVARGRPLAKVFESEAELLDIVEKAILLFRDKGITGERFSDTIERLGFENVEALLMSDELLKNKAQNLSEQKHLVGGATC